MIQRRDRLRLPLEPREHVRVLREGFGQDFDGDVAAQLRVPRPVHLSHSPGAERREDFVRPQQGSRIQRQINSAS